MKVIQYYATYKKGGECPVFPTYTDRTDGDPVSVFQDWDEAVAETSRLNQMVARARHLTAIWGFRY